MYFTYIIQTINSPTKYILEVELIVFSHLKEYFQFSDTVWLGLGNKDTWLG